MVKSYIVRRYLQRKDYRWETVAKDGKAYVLPPKPVTWSLVLVDSCSQLKYNKSSLNDPVAPPNNYSIQLLHPMTLRRGWC